MFSFWFLAALGVASGWAYSTDWGSRPYVYKVYLPFSKTLFDTGEDWHDFHCHKRSHETGCERRPVIQGEWPDIFAAFNADQRAELDLSIATFLSQNPAFVATPSRDLKIDLSCCNNTEQYRWGYILAMSPDSYLTFEDQDGASFIRLGVIRDSHCIAPPQLPIQGTNRIGARHIASWPDHWHSWVHHFAGPKTDIGPNEIAFWHLTEGSYRPHVTYDYQYYAKFFVCVVLVWVLPPDVQVQLVRHGNIESLHYLHDDDLVAPDYEERRLSLNRMSQQIRSMREEFSAELTSLQAEMQAYQIRDAQILAVINAESRPQSPVPYQGEPYMPRLRSPSITSDNPIALALEAMVESESEVDYDFEDDPAPIVEPAWEDPYAEPGLDDDLVPVPPLNIAESDVDDEPLPTQELIASDSSVDDNSSVALTDEHVRILDVVQEGDPVDPVLRLRGGTRPIYLTVADIQEILTTQEILKRDMANNAASLVSLQRSFEEWQEQSLPDYRIRDELRTANSRFAIESGDGSVVRMPNLPGATPTPAVAAWDPERMRTFVNEQITRRIDNVAATSETRLLGSFRNMGDEPAESAMLSPAQIPSEPITLLDMLMTRTIQDQGLAMSCILMSATEGILTKVMRPRISQCWFTIMVDGRPKSFTPALGTFTSYTDFTLRVPGHMMTLHCLELTAYSSGFDRLLDMPLYETSYGNSVIHLPENPPGLQCDVVSLRTVLIRRQTAIGMVPSSGTQEERFIASVVESTIFGGATAESTTPGQVETTRDRQLMPAILESMVRSHDLGAWVKANVNATINTRLDINGPGNHHRLVVSHRRMDDETGNESLRDELITVTAGVQSLTGPQLLALLELSPVKDFLTAVSNSAITRRLDSSRADDNSKAMVSFRLDPSKPHGFLSYQQLPDDVIGRSLVRGLNTPQLDTDLAYISSIGAQRVFKWVTALVTKVPENYPAAYKLAITKFLIADVSSLVSFTLYETEAEIEYPSSALFKYQDRFKHILKTQVYQVSVNGQQFIVAEPHHFLPTKAILFEDAIKSLSN